MEEWMMTERRQVIFLQVVTGQLFWFGFCHTGPRRAVSFNENFVVCHHQVHASQPTLSIDVLGCVREYRMCVWGNFSSYSSCDIF